MSSQKKKFYSITKQSPFTDKINTLSIKMTKSQFDAYKEGEEQIQDIFPELSSDEREFLMTGLTPEEWKLIDAQLSF